VAQQSSSSPQKKESAHPHQRTAEADAFYLLPIQHHHWQTVRHAVAMFWVMLAIVLVTFKAGVAELIIRPSNAVSIEYTPVTLHCTTSPNDSCYWWAKASLRDVPLKVYDGDLEETADNSQYYVNKSQPGQCDLVILQPRLTSKFLYACRAEVYGHGELNSYASLAVLKSNLQCAHNVRAGADVVSGQTVRYSIQLVYAGEMNLSIYLERPNGSVERICSDVKKDRVTWRLECDYAVVVGGSHKFFAAVSEVLISEEDIQFDKTLPTERFYCSSSDWLKVTDELEQSPADEDTTMTAMSTAAATDGAMSSNHSVTCATVWHVWLCPSLVLVLALCTAVSLLCCCWQTLSKRRAIQLWKNGESNHYVHDVEKQKLSVETCD